MQTSLLLVLQPMSSLLVWLLKSFIQPCSAPLAGSSEQPSLRAVADAFSDFVKGTSSFSTASRPTEERYNNLEFFRLSSAAKKTWNLHRKLGQYR